MSYKIKFMRHKDLPVGHREIFWDMDDGYLGIYEDGELVQVETDRMESEDAKFYRDLSWVGVALEHAYEKGVEDGRAETNN